MATGQTLYSDISSLVNDIQEGALFTLRNGNTLGMTVTGLSSVGMNPRVGYQWGAANVRLTGEGDDITPTNFSKTTLATLTPASYRDMAFVSDQRDASDWDSIRSAASMEMGMAFADNVDTNIASNFSSLTAGTVGAAGSTLTWDYILNAHAILKASNVPGPYYCALHPYQWLDLVKEVATASSPAFVAAPMAADRIVATFYQNPMIGDVTFAISSNVDIDSSDDATGAMYSPLALAYDERKAFGIEVERDASRQGYELVASLWYAHGVWDASRGVQIVSDATAPTGA